MTHPLAAVPSVHSPFPVSITYSAAVLGPPHGVHPGVQQRQVALVVGTGPVAQTLERDI